MSAAFERTDMDGTLITGADVAGLIESGASVFLEQGACEPLALKASLTGDDVREIRVLAAPVNGLNDCSFGLSAAARLNPIVFVAAPQLADSIHRGEVKYLPLHWSEVIRAFRERFRPDYALLQVSPPDEQGYCNLGANAAFELEVAHMAKTVIAEINPNVPVVAGDTSLHQSRIAYFLQTSDPLRSMPAAGWGSLEEEIARHVNDLVPSECTMQIGPGRVPDAVMECMTRSRKKVRFHSGILTDAIFRMAAAQASPHCDGDIVAGMLLGTAELYRAVNANPRVQLRNTSYTHSQGVMSGIEHFVSVNSAIEVDIRGQVNAESVDGRQISGVGGQVDFFRGARGSKDGVSIVALPSSTRTRSRIVIDFDAGTPVTTSRVDVDYVVTEYGVASLRNRTEGERAQALIDIAHPRHRQELKQALGRRWM
jgi:4-hydroxybutyrate CoA-transferase